MNVERIRELLTKYDAGEDTEGEVVWTILKECLGPAVESASSGKSVSWFPGEAGTGASETRVVELVYGPTEVTIRPGS